MQGNIHKKSPGRPRAFDRTEALEAAVELFWRHGFDGTSVAKLIEAMKIKPPSFYAAFGSKEELFREALDLYLKKHANFVTNALGSGAPARESVRAMLQGAARAFIRDGLPRGCMVGSGCLQSAGENAPLATVLSGIRNRTRDAVQMMLDKALAEGELAPGTDTQGVAAYFSAVVQGLSVQAIDGASPDLLDRIVETAMTAWPTPSGKRALAKAA